MRTSPPVPRLICSGTTLQQMTAARQRRKNPFLSVLLLDTLRNMKELVIAGRFFDKIDSAAELGAHLDKHAPRWERVELPESFPCLVRFEVDDDGKNFPEFFTAEDLQAMSAVLTK